MKAAHSNATLQHTRITTCGGPGFLIIPLGMAISFEVRHKFDVDADTFWDKVFFDEEYNRRLYIEALGFRSFEVEKLDRRDDGTVTRRIRLVPQEDAPGPIKKILGGEFAYIEEGSFDPQKKLWTYRIQPSTMADKVDTHGQFWVEPTAGGVERVCTVNLSVKVFGVGKLAEGFIEKQTRKNYDLAAAFTNQYLRDKNLG